MPAGPAGMGFVYFAAVKLAGYTAFCHWAIRPRLAATPHPSPSLDAIGVFTALILPGGMWVC